MRRISILVCVAVFAACSSEGEVRETRRPTATGAEPSPQAPTTTTSVPPVWSPVRERGALAVHRVAPDEGGELAWQDAQDTPVGWVDVKRVAFSHSIQPAWRIELAAKPPLAASLEPGLLIAYGLVFETTGDGIADYVVGIDNDAPEQGDFHVWVTNLATGETDEQIGPPYGFPIEFSHPDEDRSGEFPAPTVTFTFLGGSAPADLKNPTRFYAWASASRGGEVFAWDYAPDTAWMGP
jgi:hypothetical protein